MKSILSLSLGILLILGVGAASAVELVNNGGFENGFDQWIPWNASTSNINAHTGEFSAWMSAGGPPSCYFGLMGLNAVLAQEIDPGDGGYFDISFSYYLGDLPENVEGSSAGLYFGVFGVDYLVWDQGPYPISIEIFDTLLLVNLLTLGSPNSWNDWTGLLDLSNPNMDRYYLGFLLKQGNGPTAFYPVGVDQVSMVAHPVPEPAVWSLMGLGLILLFGLTQWRKGLEAVARFRKTPRG